MTQPLALVFYQKLMPGSQLVNRLQDLHYRVTAISEADKLLLGAGNEGPMIIFLDLDSPDALALIDKLRANNSTSHIPLVVFGPENEARSDSARQKGATLVVGETALLSHLPGLLEQALRID